MDYYSQYGPLLPIIPPSPLSRRRDASRAVIPDFTDDLQPAESLRRWFRNVFYPAMPPSVWWQFRSSAIVIVCIVVICSLILGRRIYERSFWVFRLARREEGILIVPQSMMAFTIFAGSYGSALIALDFELCNFFQSQTAVPRNFPCWLALPWLAISTGAIFAAWGSFYARPATSSVTAPYSSSRRFSASFRARSSFTKFLRRPAMMNLCCLASPLVIVVAIMTPTLMTNARYNRQLDRFFEWADTWSNATDLNHDMLVEVQDIWYNMINMAEVISITFLIWTACAFILWVAYTWVSVRLLHAVHIQIQSLSAQAPGQVTTAAADAADSTSGSGDGSGETRGSNATHRPGNERSRSSAPAGLSTAAEPDSPTTAKSPMFSPVLGEGRASESTESGGNAPNLFSRRELAQDRPNATFWPPVKPSMIVRKKVLSRQATRQSQARYLKRVWWNLVIQGVSIDFAILSFLGAALYGGIEARTQWEHNDHGNVISRALLWASWTSVLFGCAVIGAIARRVYEPVTFTTVADAFQVRHGRKQRPVARTAPRQPPQDGSVQLRGSGQRSRSRRPDRDAGAPRYPALANIQVQTSFFETETIDPADPSHHASTHDTETPASRTFLHPGAAESSLMVGAGPQSVTEKGHGGFNRSSVSTRDTNYSDEETEGEYDDSERRLRRGAKSRFFSNSVRGQSRGKSDAGTEDLELGRVMPTLGFSGSDAGGASLSTATCGDSRERRQSEATDMSGRTLATASGSHHLKQP